MLVPCPRTRDGDCGVFMKSQDIGLLLKLVSLQKQEQQEAQGDNDWGNKAWPLDWEDWDYPERIEERVARQAMARQATARQGRQNHIKGNR